MCLMIYSYVIVFGALLDKLYPAFHLRVHTTKYNPIDDHSSILVPASAPQLV